MSGPDRATERGISTENSQTAADKKAVSFHENETAEIFLQWTLLPLDHMNALLDLSVDQVQLRFEDMLGLKKHQTCLNEAALLDYFVAGFWWAKEMNFTCQQISFIMALLQLLLDNIKDKQMPCSENFKVFAKKLLTARKSSADTVSPLFDSDQIKSITDYFKSSLFQHYRLYQFLFTQPRDEVLLGMERSIEVANSSDFAAPLEEGMPSEVYFRYTASSPATPLAQGLDECLQKNEEEPGESQQAEGHESLEGFSMEDVREVLGEMTKEMLTKLQADFTEKLRLQEETYTSRLDSLKSVASK
ncbi:ciliary-associated calcium-binding coiled-coil protein 1 [Colossoma macropomum]|uniref:ciliary-associated calcium-binding coiled-coil protein 1 n=1 Tax=Colossoma macropomum TaxID=42526 RepID=UPI0018641243|nr:ciliary-associated calcium-binding coiled-coil protein 1 [Colossoma macropomum]